MPYNAATDFVGLWRTVAEGVEKAEMPGLDFVVAALGRAGLIRVVFSEMAPTTLQSTTAWFRTAHPSYAAEGALYLWDQRVGTYVPATPELFLVFMMAFTNDDLIAIFAVTGAPTDDIGKDGDYAIRLDAPGGIYGPKAGGHWPAQPLPGTSYSQISHFLDWLGQTQGDLVFRNSTSWDVLQPASGPGQVLHSGGAGANPFWSALSSTDIDQIFGGGTQGDIIYRSATAWSRLAAGANGNVLTTHGAAQNPSWTSITGPGGVFDINFPGSTVGSIIWKSAAGWTWLPSGPAGYVLETNGAQPFWNTTAALVGPPGPPGASGPAGPAGVPGPPGASGVANVQLVIQGDHTTLEGGMFVMVEPVFGGVMTGWGSDWAASYPIPAIFRFRYLQVFTTSWFTVAYVG